MNGEVPSVPITTLAGIASLTDLLTELPLPSPLPSAINSKGLLYTPQIAEEAQRLLGRQDENLIPQLLHVLSQTDTDHIELKDKTASNEVEGEVPALLQAILARNPNVFKSRVEQLSGSGSGQHSSYSPRGGPSNSSSPGASTHGNQHQFQQPGSVSAQGSTQAPLNGYAANQFSPAPASSPMFPATPPSVGTPNSQTRSQRSPSRAPATATREDERQGVNSVHNNEVTDGRGRPTRSQSCSSETNHTNSNNQPDTPVDTQGESSAGMLESDNADAGRSRWSSKRKKRKDRKDKDKKEKDKKDKDEVSYNIIQSPTHSGLPKITLKIARKPVTSPKASESEPSTSGEQSKPPSVEPSKPASTEQQHTSHSDIKTEVPDQRLQPDINTQHQDGVHQSQSKESRTEQRVSEPNRTPGSHQQHVDNKNNSIAGPPRKSVLRLRNETNSDVQNKAEVVQNKQEQVHKPEESSRTHINKGQGDADSTPVPAPAPAKAPVPVESAHEMDKEEPMDAEPSVPSEHARAKAAQPRVVLTKLLPSTIEEDLIPMKLDGRGKKRGRGSVNYCEISPSSSPRHRPSTVNAMDNDWGPPATAAPAASSSRSPSHSRLKAPSPVPEGPPQENAPIFIERNEAEEEEAEKEERPAKRAKKEEKPKKKKGQTDAEYEELMDTPTFKRFNTAIDAVFENSEDMEVNVDTGDEEEEEYAPDTLISKPLLADLVNEAAKLKSLSVMNQVKTERLVRLLNILERNIRDGTKVNPNDQDEQNPREQRLWREVTMERVTRSVDSSLIALYIMTSEDMPKEVFIEDVIDRLSQLAKFQLTNTIYPEFDPVYRVNPKKEVIATHTKLKRARAGEVKEKSVLMVYNKLCSLVTNLAELLNLQILTDSTVLLISSMGTAPFFVENVSELQLNSLKLISAVFSRYEKHRQLILEDIFASLARLPSSKKNLRNFRLNNTTNIQMVTALVLQLIQGVVVFNNPDGDSNALDQYDDVDDEASKQTDQGVLVVNAYETAVRTGQNFLSVFLKKCVSKDEEDYRPLFENFVQDLLSAVNKPEWPASELLLSLLGRLLMHQFSNRSNEMSMRVSSLEYLGQVASRLRKDAISSVMDEDRLNTIVREMRGGRESPVGDGKPCDKLDYVMNLQQAMVDYLSYNSRNDPAILFSRQFFLAQWYRDTNAEVEQTMKAPQSKKKKKDSDDEDSDDEDEDSEEEEEEDKSRESVLKTAEILRAAEKRKKFLISAIKVKKPALSIRKGRNIITYESAAFVVRYLASRRPFSQSFDIYLTQILRVLNETAVAVRTRAMKCLSQVVAADPNILARADVQKTVHCRFMDQSTSVREAAVELVGRFVLMQPELTDQYYEMLIERILDTGISVRKRVIKTLRDICIDQPEFTKIPEICVRIIRRVNDEEGIKKLVNETFQKMWFTPMPNQNKNLLLQRALNIIEVVAASKDTGYDWLEQLLTNLLKGEEDAHYKPVQKACVQVTDCLVEHVLRLERGSAEVSEEGKASSKRLVSCLQTLYLFSKVKPTLMVAHATTLQPYLSTKCATQRETMVISNVARILEMVVPLMDHPSEVFLASLEEDMMRLILKHGQMVLQSCVSCLGSIVNRVTHNYRLVRDCFQKYFTILAKMKTDHDSSSESPISKNKPVLLRSLFTVGLFCKHFDFDAGLKHSKSSPKVPVRDRVFDVLLYFCNREDEDIKLKALSGLGFLCNRHADFMLTTEVKDLYWKILTDPYISVKQLCLVVRNLHLYLVEEDERMRQADAEWKAHAKEEDLKEMGDVQSGMSSSVMQMYLKQVMECMLHKQSMVRMAALQVIVLTLGQGLVHPVQCVPYLVAMGSDPESAIRVKADQQLTHIDQRYPGFIQMKALAGLKMSYKLQEILNSETEEYIRGMRERDNHHYALCSHLYSMIRSNRSHRRAILLSLLNLFDEHVKSDLNLLVFVADNLSSFPYQAQDEPLFIMHHIEIIVSVSGANLLQSFKDSFCSNQPSRPPSRASQNSDSGRPSRTAYEDDDEDDAESLIERIPEEPTQLLECCVASQAVIMLLVLKQHLKDLYGFRDNTIHRYSPTEAAKVYEKAVNRKSLVHFNPARALDLLKTGQPKPPLSEQEKKDIVEEYLDFKQLMELMDDSEDEEEDGGKPKAGSGPGTPVRNQTGEDGEVKEEVKEEGTNHNEAGGGGSTSPAAARKTPEPAHIPSSRTRQVRKHSAEDEDSSEESIPSPVPVAKSRARSRTPARSKSRQGGRGGSSRKRPQKKRRRRIETSDEEDDDDEDSEDPDW
ncbi:nipped-B-like protein A isoform X1 [Lytechinus pictus]|uniref:nipped-B-like protein A isoform X1 n=1 Tax=Lytechinus pictus TaxID=7653 RepID=UPI0030B9DCEA